MAFAIVYLHGVGQGVNSDDWYRAMSSSLEARDITVPSLQSRRTIRPAYVDLLQGIGIPDRVKPPRHTTAEPGRAADKLTRRADYARRQATAIDHLPGTVTGAGFQGVGRFAGNVDLSKVPLPFDLPDAKKYLRDERLRSCVLHRVVDAIGTQRDLVVIGHSLGSLVAIDLLAHLPPDVRVRRLVTIGSPAGVLGFLKSRPEVLLRDFPYHQVEGWVNLFSPYDPATYGTGLSARFPAAADVRVSGGMYHAADKYLAHPGVAKVIADALRPAATGWRGGAEVAIPLDQNETNALDAVIFARLVADRITNQDKKLRFGLALRHVRQQVGSELIQRRAGQGLPVPLDLVRLRDGQALPKLSHRPIDEALLFAIVNATGNPVAPFEIKVESEQLATVSTTWVRYGYLRSDGQRILEAVRAAKDHFGDDWNKLLIGAVGLALIAAGPVGLILAAPAGLAGAAAITASLAAFGPGGMVGGMALAGGLVGAGSAVGAGALMPSGMSENMVRTQVIRSMAFARAHEDLGLPEDGHRSWHYMNAWHDQLATEAAQLGVLSDDNSSTMKSLRSKLKTVEKGLQWMVDQGLAPILAP